MSLWGGVWFERAEHAIPIHDFDFDQTSKVGLKLSLNQRFLSPRPYSSSAVTLARRIRNLRGRCVQGRSLRLAW